MIILINP